jgi:hypothetical protein
VVVVVQECVYVREGEREGGRAVAKRGHWRAWAAQPAAKQLVGCSGQLRKHVPQGLAWS